MRSFMGTVTLAALLSTAVALPKVPKLLKIAVKQVPHGKVFKNGALQVNSTYAKFASAGAVAPANVLAAAEVAAQQGSVSASPLQFDQAYLSPVTVGNSELMLDFDTGSADLWVFSTETPTKSAKGHALYNTSSGTSLDGYTWAITYGDGSGASGNVFADKVVIGSVTATSQAVEAATSVAKSFARNTDQDGLVGLAFSKINKVSPQPQTTFFDTVKSSLAAQVFTSALQKGAPGDYTFGYVDSSLYSGNISYVPVDTSKGFWEFTAGTYSIGSGSPAGNIGDSIADTGTSLLYIPNAAAKKYYAQIPGAVLTKSAGGYTLPCDATPPDFNVNIGTGTFTVPGSYMIYAPLASGSTTCFGGIQSSRGFGFNIFGDVFLKSVYAVFDETQSSPNIGFAAQP